MSTAPLGRADRLKGQRVTVSTKHMPIIYPSKTSPAEVKEMKEVFVVQGGRERVC